MKVFRIVILLLAVIGLFTVSAGTVEVRRDKVSSNDVVDESLGAVDIAPGACDSSELAAEAVYYPKLAGSEYGRMLDGHPAADTCFVVYSEPGSDSVYNFVTVDEAGDTLALRKIISMSPTAEHLRFDGPYAGIRTTGNAKIYADHRFEVYKAGQTPDQGEDIHTQGGNSVIESVDSLRVYETEFGASYEWSWRFINNLPAPDDTMDVVQTITMRRGLPYYIVHYEFTWIDTTPDSLRFMFYSQPKQATATSTHDVGFVPGYGEVRRRRVFDMDQIGHFAGMLNIGNAAVTWKDTLDDGTSSYLSKHGIVMDYGSGDSTWASCFLAFKPPASEFDSATIAPHQVVYVDTNVIGSGYVVSLAADSLVIHVDTTETYGAGRYILFRTKFIPFARPDLGGRVRTLEYAIGRGYFIDDQMPPVFPEVVWSDGTTSRWPNTRKR